MPASLTVRPAARLAEVRLAGSVTGGEIAEAALDLTRHPDWDPHYRVIWDATRVSDLDLPLDAFQLLLDQERRFQAEGEAGELVFVVTDAVYASLVTLFTRRVKDTPRRITAVRTLAEAYAHLGAAAE